MENNPDMWKFYYFIPDGGKIDLFEYWKKFNLISKDSLEWLKGLTEAIELNQYAVWAINQLTVWGSTHWAKWDTLAIKLALLHNEHKKLLGRERIELNNT